MLPSVPVPQPLSVDQAACCPATLTSTCANNACPSVNIDRVSVSYHGRVVVRDVSLTAPTCQVTAIVGPSGCGKSTLLSCVNRLIDLVPNVAVTGTIRLSGEDIRAPTLPVATLRRRVGMIFQQPNPFPLSIRRNLSLPLREHGTTDQREIDAVSERCLRSVGLWDEVANRLDHSALNLSGGQQQRLCLARALVLRPQVLLLDEPCSALDPMASGVVEDLIVSLKGFYTVIIVTHDLAQARRIADQVVVCGHDGISGYVLEQGHCEAVFTNPTNPRTAAYLAGRRN